jgi:hypothetical protein
MNFFRDFLERMTVGVNTNKKLLRIPLCRLVDKQTVSGPNVDDDSSVVRSNQLPKSSPVNLSEGFTAD